MGKALIEVLLQVATLLVSIICVPIDIILQGLFPDLELYLGKVTQVLESYVVPFSGYFVSILPPITRNLIGVYLIFVVGLGAALLTYHSIVLIVKLIGKIKFW